MKEKRTITVEIDEDSPYHESVGTGSLIDLIEERNCGENTGIKVTEIK